MGALLPHARNVKTGEVVKEDSPLKVKSQALYEVTIRIKEMELLKKVLQDLIKPHLMEAATNGESKLDIWTIQKGRVVFDKDSFEENADEETKETYAAAKGTVATIEGSFVRHSEPFLKISKF